MLRHALRLLPLLVPTIALAQAPEPATVASEAGTLRIERLAPLEYPWGLALLPDGRVLVTEKPGRLRLWADGRLSEPLAGVPAVVHLGGRSEQGGLMDVAVDPDFAENRRIYLSFSEAAEEPDGPKDEGDPRLGGGGGGDDVVRGGAVARAVLDGDRLVDVTVIWRQVPKTVGRGHFGNRLVFGPDKLLYVTSGDRMRFDPAQQLDSNLGKVVRIATDGSFPSSNPFADREGARGDVYSLGHRNILAAAIHPHSGALWVFEMGPKGGDELNVVRGGRNYGWPRVSDGVHYDGSPIPDHARDDGFVAPAHRWTPVISPSGALFYDGAAFPAWNGQALVGSLSDRSIVRLQTDGTRVTGEERIAVGHRVRDLAQAADGTLLMLTDADDGGLYRIAPAERR